MSPTIERMDAIIYCRVSTEDQARVGTSLSTQEAECRAWCTKHGYTVTKCFVEAGESAKTSDRPKFLELIEHCRKYKPAACVVWKFDRWARNSMDHAVYAAQLAKSGTRLVSATEPAADDPSGRLLQTILSAFAQFDNEIRGDRARQAMKAVTMAGGWCTHSPFGFKHARSGQLPILVEDLTKADAVREMFEGLAMGRRNMPQTILLAREHKIAPNTVRAILRNPIYAGFNRSALTGWQEVETAFPGLVKRSTWDRVQEILTGKRPKMGTRRVEREEFPLRGLVRCHACGKPLTSGWTKGRSQKYGYYVCHENHVRIRVEAMHTAFLDLLEKDGAVFVELLKKIESTLHRKIEERMEAGHNLWRHARDELVKIEAKRKRLLDAYVSGAVSQVDYTNKDQELSAMKTAAEANKEGKEFYAKDVDAILAKAVVIFSDPVALWARLPLDAKRRFALQLYAGQLVLTKDLLVEPQSGVGFAGVIKGVAGGDLQNGVPGWSMAQLMDAIQVLSEIAA